MASGYAWVAALFCLFATLPANASGIGREQAHLHHTSHPAGTVVREPAFAYRIVPPEVPDGRVLVLMHGSGGDETTLMSLASRIAPGATLIGVRGRIVQDGIKRWYRRLTPTEFDQQDVRAEAAAFADFLGRTARDLDIDLSGVTFLGYSNGANLIAAISQLHPGLVRKAVLLRPMSVLADQPAVDLSGTRFLTIAGREDKLYFPFAPGLEARLRHCGASVDYKVVPAGHDLGEEDVLIAAEWLGSIGK
jgi:phospholipase/carboxylesterase